jgi:aryl-alcohol dehydrogenase-like predicted oxidoreductase
MSRPGVTAPLASATSLEQLDDLVAAADLSVPASVLAALDRAGG